MDASAPLPAPALPAGDAFLLSRSELSSRRPKQLHCHVEHELLWVQNGEVRLHLAGGKETLGEGALLFVPPGLPHGLQGRGEAPLLVSVLIDPALVTALGDRHPALAGRFFWTGEARPDRHDRDMRQMAELSRAALRLERGGRDALSLEAFLLPLLADLVESVPDLPDTAPDWLVRACVAATDPGVFRQGAAGLARAAGRAHPHVARTLKRLTGLTPSDYVNRIRMDHAARKLTGSDDTLAEIAEECGVPNLSHFHKLFRARHGTTPQRYRAAFRRDVVQPGV